MTLGFEQKSRAESGMRETGFELHESRHGVYGGMRVFLREGYLIRRFYNHI